MNREFYIALHDVPYPVVRAQALTARSRMLRAWGTLPEHSPEADRWIAKSGPEHYEEHLPRLQDWVAQLSGGRVPSRRQADLHRRYSRPRFRAPGAIRGGEGGCSPKTG